MLESVLFRLRKNSTRKVRPVLILAAEAYIVLAPRRTGGEEKVQEGEVVYDAVDENIPFLCTIDAQ